MSCSMKQDASAPGRLHYKKWLVIPSIDLGKLEHLHTDKTWKTSVVVYQYGKTATNIIHCCSTIHAILTVNTPNK